MVRSFRTDSIVYMSVLRVLPHWALKVSMVLLIMSILMLISITEA